VPNFVTSFVDNLNGSDMFQDLGIDVRILLKFHLMESVDWICMTVVMDKLHVSWTR
jgi:hypothetical protein